MTGCGGEEHDEGPESHVPSMDDDDVEIQDGAEAGELLGTDTYEEYRDQQRELVESGEISEAEFFAAAENFILCADEFDVSMAMTEDPYDIERPQVTQLDFESDRSADEIADTRAVIEECLAAHLSLVKDSYYSSLGEAQTDSDVLDYVFTCLEEEEVEVNGDETSVEELRSTTGNPRQLLDSCAGEAKDELYPDHEVLLQ